MRSCCENCYKININEVKPYTLNVPDEVYLCTGCYEKMMGRENQVNPSPNRNRLRSENMETGKGIDWNAFEAKSNEAYLKRKPGIKYMMTFKKDSLIQIATNFKETKIVDGKEQVTEKPGVALRLTLETLDGQQTEKTLDITSKKEAQTIKGYLEAGMLYNQKFAITASGEGTQRVYAWMNLGPK